MMLTELAETPSFYAGYAVGEIILLVVPLLFLAIGIVVAIRLKTAGGKGCGIALAVVSGLVFCLAVVGSLFQILSHTLITVPTQWSDRVVQANDGSCEISVPASWIDTPELSKEAVLGAKDPRGTEYVLVFTESKQDYTGTLAEYVRDVSNRLRDKLTTPQIEAPASITINGRSAIRQSFKRRNRPNTDRLSYYVFRRPEPVLPGVLLESGIKGRKC